MVEFMTCPHGTVTRPKWPMSKPGYSHVEGVSDFMLRVEPCRDERTWMGE